nr:class I SAM-dependent methyltransferase [uncultured Chitinophaga sp.]
MNTQKNAFLAYEANAWFNRNREYVTNYDRATDPVISLIGNYSLGQGNVLEIGCSAGHRLNGIRTEFPGIAVTGVDPSSEAIAYGQSAYEGVNLLQGTADRLDLPDNHFDIVIIGFVLYVVDRALIFRAAAEADRVLKNGGTLILIDFFAESTTRNPYAYISGANAFSFKQNYDELFTASHLYHLLDKSTWNHLNKRRDATDDYYNKYCITLLRKDLDIAYKPAVQ